MSARQESATEADIKKRLFEVALIGRRDGDAAALTYTLETIRRAEQAFGTNHGYVGAASRHAGALLYRMKRYEDSARAYLRALTVVAHYVDIGHDHYRQAVANVAASWMAAGQPDHVVALYEHILKSPQARGGDTFEASFYRIKLASLLRQRGRFVDAERHMLAVIATREREKGPDDRSVGFALTELGGLQRVMGRFADAEATYLRTLAIIRRHEGNDAVNIGIVSDNLAYVYNELGRRADAERLHRLALAIFENKLGPEHPTTAQGYANLATLYYVQNRDAEARPLYERALAVFTKRLPPNDPRIGVILDQYAGLERRARRYKEARVLYERALASLTAAHGRSHPETAKVMNNMALAEQALGNLDAAERLMRSAVAAQEQAFGPNHFLVGAGLGNLGDVLLARGKLEPALDALVRAIRIIEASVGPEHPALLPPLRRLAGVYISLRRPDDALGYVRRSVRVALADARRNRLDLEGARDITQSADALNAALHVLWRATEAKPELTDTLAGEAFEIGQWLTQTAAGRTLSQIGVRIAARDPAIADLVRQRQDLGRRWAQLNGSLVADIARPRAAGGSPEAARLRTEIAAVEADVARLEAAITERFPEFETVSDPKPLSFETVRALVRPDEAVAQFVNLGAETYVWIATRDRLVWRRLATPSREIWKMVLRLRCGLDSGEWIGDRRSLRCLDLVGEAPNADGLLPFDAGTAAALYDALLRPVEADIGKRSLLIVPSGSLTQLPFQVLVASAPKTGQSRFDLRGVDWFARHRATSILPSVASLGVLRAKDGASKARLAYLAIANPLLVGADGADRRAFDIAACGDAEKATLVARANTIDANGIVIRSGIADARSVRALAPLPETAAEVCRVARDLGTNRSRVLIGAEAHEAALRAMSESGELARYRLVHFATHGLVSGELRGLAEPALVLTPPEQSRAGDDGLLLASEVAALKLDADWVVLSACNTGAGDSEDGEALSGLANAFFHAGARSLLVSHWPVQSDAAVDLVTRAIAELGGGRQAAVSKGEALRRAMVALIANARAPAEAHPSSWAPFVVIGETGGRIAMSASKTRARSSGSTTPPAIVADPQWAKRAFGAQ